MKGTKIVVSAILAILVCLNTYTLSFAETNEAGREADAVIAEEGRGRAEKEQPSEEQVPTEPVKEEESPEKQNAVENPVRYTVTFMAHGKIVGTAPIEENKCMKKPADPKPADETQYFSCWVDKNGDVFDFDVPVTKDLTLYARFEYYGGPIPPEKRFLISFDSCGGSPVKNQQIVDGDKIKRPESPSKKGYRFLGWYEKDKERWNFDTAPDRSMTLYARWQKQDGAAKNSNKGYGDRSPQTSDNQNLLLLYLLCGIAAVVLMKTWRGEVTRLKSK